MKIIKNILAGILLLAGIILVIGLFVPRDFNYEKSITVNAPIEVVWENVNSLADLDKWSPWNDLDPGMKKELTGTDGTVGAMQSWDSDVKAVGKGSQTISKIVAPELFETRLKFYNPYESEAKGYISLTAEGPESTRVTWGFESEMPYPFNLMKFTMDMEKTMGNDWDRGLTKLKNICEN